MDMATISTAYTSIKIVKESISGLLGTKIESAAKEKVNEALDKLGAVQDSLFYLREELGRLQSDNSDLKDQLRNQGNWENKLAEYHLEETEGGAVVYAFKKTPEHYACPRCVVKKEIQILQDERVITGEFKCPGCDKYFPINQAKSLGPIMA